MVGTGEVDRVGGSGAGVAAGQQFVDRSKVRILLCDGDSNSSREVLRLLCNCSYQVTCAKSPRQVINILNYEGGEIDIILAEVDLPVAKCFKMLKYIARNRDLRHIPIIMMSNRDEVPVVVKCLRLGAAEYLVKPLRTNELLNLWTHVWRRRRMLGLPEKNFLNDNFELVHSEPSDANTTSTTLLSDETDDRPKETTNQEIGTSNQREYEILNIFQGASGLACNVNKCQMVPIRCSEEAIQEAAATFPCIIAGFPIKYLGIPLSVHKVPKVALQPLLDRVADHLPTWKGRLMNRSGRLILIKTTLSAISVHTAIAMKLPPWFIKALIKIFRAFLWQGEADVQAGKCLVAWNSIQRPLDMGGLGILNPNLFGEALRLRWCWLQRTDLSRPWSGLPAKDNDSLQAFFNSSIAIQLGDGKRVSFWSDPWLNGRSIQEIAPALTAATSKHARNSRSVADALNNRRWFRDINGALTIPVIMEYLTIRQLVDGINLSTDPDTFIWKWSATGIYSSASAYKALHMGQTSLLGARELWKTKAPNNCRFFFWLILQGRCWTSERLHRHGIRADDTCALCAQQPELLDHLLTGCVFSREVWFKLLRRMGWQALTPSANGNTVEWWLRCRKQVPKERRKAFDSLCLAACWAIWKERNSRVFRAKSLQPAALVQKITEDLLLWCRAGLVDRSRLIPM